jgi:two-component system sensor histidine kinase RpfC
MLDTQAAGKHLRFSVYVEPTVPHRLRGDDQLVQQVLVNLTANAIKFTDQGSVTIAVSEPTPASARVARLCFEVADTGVGVPPEMATRIFESFTQVDQTIARRYGGTGLGLSIAKQIVDLMGGEIGVRPRPGGGSIFWFTLELPRLPVRQSIGQFRSSTAEALIISGDQEELERLVAAVRRLGLTARGIGQAARAIIHIRNRPREERPDIVLLDERSAGLDAAHFSPARSRTTTMRTSSRSSRSARRYRAPLGCSPAT